MFDQGLARSSCGLREFLRDEQGAASIEYALLLALLVATTAGVWAALGAKVKETVVTVSNVVSAPID